MRVFGLDPVVVVVVGLDNDSLLVAWNLAPDDSFDGSRRILGGCSVLAGGLHGEVTSHFHWSLHSVCF